MGTVVTSTAELPGQTRYAVAFGVFDGLHLGHQAVIRNLLELAADTGARPAVMFFAPFPRNVLFPERPVPALQDETEKAEMLFRLGVDTVIRAPFTRELARLSPEAFLEQHFLNPLIRPAFTAFCVGDDWRFGHQNSGDAALLKRLGEAAGLKVRIVAPVWHDGRPISSTRIREALIAGDLPTATAMLGRPPAITGPVASGLGLAGNRLDCPTANIRPANGLALPPNGVYATRAFLPFGEACPAIAYLGDAPTIRPEDGRILLEVHLLDQDRDLRGLSLTVQLLAFLRPSLKFDSPDALAEQIRRDIRDCRRLCPDPASRTP